MAPRYFSITASSLLLLLIATLHSSYVDAGLVLSSLPTEKISAEKQLNASQAFVKTWQIESNASESATVIDHIEANLPCQTFITYESPSSLSSSSGILGEVRVSGSTEFIIGAVAVIALNPITGPQLLLQTVNVSTVEEFLHVEIVLFVKNKLKVLENRYTKDVVVLEDVLYSNPNGELPYNQVLESGSGTRRLSDVASLVVEADTKAGISNNTYTMRVWKVKWSAGKQPSSAQHVDLKYALPGTAGLFQVSPGSVATGIAGTINITESGTASAIHQIEVILNATSQEIQVRYKTNANGTEGRLLSMDANFVPLLKVNATFEKIKTVGSALNHLDIAWDDRVMITAHNVGNIFVSDKSLQVNTTYATKFITKSSGEIQVELKDIWSRDGVYFQSDSDGNITYIGAHHSSLSAYLKEGSLCFPSGSAYMELLYSTKADLVSYLEKGNATSLCLAKLVPKRRMTRLVASQNPTDPDSPLIKTIISFDGDFMNGFGTMVTLMSIGILVGTVVVIAIIVYVLKKTGCFECCKSRSKREEIPLGVPVADYYRK